MRSFPFFHLTLRGSTTYRRPGGFTVALPQRRVARSYEAALNDMVDPTSWRKHYTVTIDASTPLSPELVGLRFVPKHAGTVDHTTAIVDRNDKTIRQIDWFYADGGHARVTQSFAAVGGLLLISHQTIDVATRQANVLADADLGNYSMMSRRPVAFKPRVR